MKTPRTTKKNKRTFLIPLIALVALLGIAAAYILLVHKPASEKANTTDTSEELLLDKSKGGTTPAEGLPENSDDSTSDDVPTSDSLSISVSSFSQSNGTIETKVTTNASGTCVITFKPADGGKPVTRQVGVTDDACSISVSENEFSYIGQWSLTVTLYHDGQKAEVEQNVTIN